MILIVGGRASGKFDYIRELGYSELDIAQGILDQRPVLYGLQELVWQDPTGVEALLPQLLEKQVIACDEVGLGVIPLDARVGTSELVEKRVKHMEQQVQTI